MKDDKHPEQAPDANRAPGQDTPSRSYGRQVAADGTRQDVDNAAAAEQIGAATTERDDSAQH